MTEATLKKKKVTSVKQARRLHRDDGRANKEPQRVVK